MAADGAEQTLSCTHLMAADIRIEGPEVTPARYK